MPIMPMLFYLSIAVGVAAVVFYLFKRRERGDDSATKLGLHS